MKPKFYIASIFTTLFVALSATVHADPVIWTGGPGGDFFDPTNWDDNTGPQENTAFVGDIVIPPGSSPVAGAGLPLILASGSTLTVTDSTLDFTGRTFQGQTNLDTDAVFNFTNSTVTVNSVANDAVLNLSGKSTLNLLGVNNSINGNNTPTNNTRVNLGDGSKVIHVNGNNGAGGATVGSRIFRSTSVVDFATDFASLPLTEFTLTGDSTPFVTPNDGAFTITAVNRDILVGYQLVPPQASAVVWLPTYRTATDWQINLDGPQIANFGWAGITDVYLADLNGDGLSDKVMRQTANNGLANPSQIIVSYTTASPTGFATSNNFNSPFGDLEVPFVDMSASKTDLIFGDFDGDGIDDAGVTVDGADRDPVGIAGQLNWKVYKSETIVGISNANGADTNHIGWSVFGDTALGDKGFLGDFNGDGIADRMIYRTTTNQAFIDLSTPGSFGDDVPDYGPIALGIPGDTIHVSDINGDGKDDLVLGRNNTPPEENIPITGDLQTIYGFYNDGTGFSTLNGASPNITDIWTVGPGIGFLFGTIPPPAADLSNFRVTQITSAGPDIAFSGSFFAPVPGSYQIQANLDLSSTWQFMSTVVTAEPGTTVFSISDSQLDTTFGAGSRPKVFIRVVKQP